MELDASGRLRFRHDDLVEWDEVFWDGERFRVELNFQNRRYQKRCGSIDDALRILAEIRSQIGMI